MCGEDKKLDCLYEWEIHTSTKKSNKQSRCTWDCCRWVTAEIRKSTNRCILVQDVFLQHVRFGCELPLRWTWRAGWKSIQNPIQSSQPIPSLLRPIWLPTSHRGQRFFANGTKKRQPPRCTGVKLEISSLKSPGDSVIPGPPNSYNLWKPWSKAVKMATCPIKSLVDLWRKKVEQINDEQKQSLPMSSHILHDKSWRTRSSLGWVRLNTEALFAAKPVDLCRALQVLKAF